MPPIRKEPVHIRYKELKNGNKSVYLDIYAGGRRRYEFLKLYIIPEASPWDRERNKVTIAHAEAAKARRVLEIQSGKYGIVQGTAANRIRLYDYLVKIADTYKKGSTTNLHILTTARLIKEYGDIYLSEVNKEYLQGFIKFLSKYVGSFGKVIRGTTQQRRFASLCTVLNRAKRDGLIGVNPVEYIDQREKPKREAVERGYLTADEVRKLSETTIRRGSVKRAFLFSCFCGLRLSDIRALKWTEIQDTGNGLQIVKKQAKTGEVVRVPLSANAVKWLPERGKNPLVFWQLPSVSAIRMNLIKWAEAANLGKHLHFHMARHTCATLLLTYGADIYTVSKILGHTNISTTQIYGQVIDKRRAEAVNLVPDI